MLSYKFGVKYGLKSLLFQEDPEIDEHPEDFITIAWGNGVVLASRFRAGGHTVIVEGQSATCIGEFTLHPDDNDGKTLLEFGRAHLHDLFADVKYHRDGKTTRYRICGGLAGEEITDNRPLTQVVNTVINNIPAIKTFRYEGGMVHDMFYYIDKALTPKVPFVPRLPNKPGDYILLKNFTDHIIRMEEPWPLPLHEEIIDATKWHSMFRRLTVGHDIYESMVNTIRTASRDKNWHLGVKRDLYLVNGPTPITELAVVDLQD